MELKDQLSRESDERVLATIRAFLTLSDYGVFGSHTHAVNVDLLHVAGNRLAAAAARIAELEAKVEKLEAENAGLALDKLTAAPPTPAGLRITPSPYVPAESGPSWQDYDVSSISGELPHFSMIRVVRRVSGADRDHPAFALIERRLLAGNPVEA
ncbi:hypothetical protein Bcep22_gp37 [Burkholderia phage Bcep22]|uniref:Uncharacterized protein n=1 Tax=Burkholderia phage Bcep22 TaxID=2883944 RepID=Q6V7Q6_9CAUD|nr:hypothetical protein Bcep22_gp37 [Burkholderia phage Bcep22]AAQ54970.1 hypothetical protein Bcep22_gp37 [Burkholderia phage Bcep22]